MAKKKLQVVTIDDISFGIIGVFTYEQQEYIALSSMDGEDMIYLYGYAPLEDGTFDVVDIESEELFDQVANEFEYIMNNQLWD